MRAAGASGVHDSGRDPQHLRRWVVLVDGNNVLCTPGGDKATMVALNKLTGDLVWKAVREGDRGAGHASIVLSELGGTRVYVQTTGGGALGVRASDGALLWSYPIDKTTAVAPTPIVRGDLVFFSAGYRRGAVNPFLLGY